MYRAVADYSVLEGVVSFQLQSKYPSKVSAMKVINVLFFFYF